MEKIKAIICEPNKPPRLDYIAQDLETLQNIVGGYIDVTHALDSGACIVLNDEGKILNLALNRPLRDKSGAIYDVIAGTFIIVGDTGAEEFTSLTDEEAARYMTEYAEPITEATADIYKPLAAPRLEFVPCSRLDYL